jgi:hypothetical protein
LTKPLGWLSINSIEDLTTCLVVSTVIVGCRQKLRLFFKAHSFTMASSSSTGLLGCRHMIFTLCRLPHPGQSSVLNLGALCRFGPDHATLTSVPLPTWQP